MALHERRNLQFFGNLAVKASCINDQTFVSLHILKQLLFGNLPQIRIRPYHLKNAKIRIGYGQSVLGGMSGDTDMYE